MQNTLELLQGLVEVHVRVPSDEERDADRSTEIGSFNYPAREAFRADGLFDESSYSELCDRTEMEVRREVAGFLNDHFIGTSDLEIRLSEMFPGEIRVYW
jgi:hypothetical protein